MRRLLAPIGITLLLVAAPAAAVAGRPKPVSSPTPTTLAASAGWISLSRPQPYCTQPPWIRYCVQSHYQGGGVARLFAAGTPVPGKLVTFTNSLGATCTTPTDGNGEARWTCVEPAALEAGYDVTFAGDTQYGPSEATAGPMTVHVVT